MRNGRGGTRVGSGTHACFIGKQASLDAEHHTGSCESAEDRFKVKSIRHDNGEDTGDPCNVGYDHEDTDGDVFIDVYNDNPTHYLNGGPTIKLEEPFKEGFTFVRWSLGGKTVTSIDTNMSENIILTGIFKKGENADISDKEFDAGSPRDKKVKLKVIIHKQHTNDDDYDIQEIEVYVDVKNRVVLNLNDLGVKVNSDYVLNKIATNLSVTPTSKEVNVFLDKKTYTLTYVTRHNGKTEKIQKKYKAGETVKLKKVSKLSGKTSFDGWYADKGCTSPVKSVKMTTNRTVYGTKTDYTTYHAVVNIGSILYAAKWVPYADGTSHHVAFVIGTARSDFFSIKILDKVNIGNKTYDVTRISADAFKGLKKLKQVYIGSEMFMVNGGAFANCPSLNRVVLPGRQCVLIKKNAFKNCKSLTDVQIQGQPYVTIEKGAFSGDKRLKRIYIKTKSLKSSGGIKATKVKVLPFIRKKGSIKTRV